jgi:hypothetical protein
MQPIHAGTQLVGLSSSARRTSRVAAGALFALLAADEETTWIEIGIFGRG